MRASTSVALIASFTVSCAAITRGAVGTAAPSYTPAQVRLVQRSLNERGYDMELTGVYDQRTRAAVMDFQRSQGMGATGELDAGTARALGLRPSDVLPVRAREEPQDRIQEHAWTDGGA